MNAPGPSESGPTGPPSLPHSVVLRWEIDETRERCSHSILIIFHPSFSSLCSGFGRVLYDICRLPGLGISSPCSGIPVFCLKTCLFLIGNLYSAWLSCLLLGNVSFRF